MMRWLLVAAALACVTDLAQAQTRKPMARETTAIRDCAIKYRDDLDGGERQCLFNLVATPCTKTKEGASDNGTSDCYRLETAIWDDLLNANFKVLLGTLNDQQTEKARAWIAYRDTTCSFYWDKIQGTMAGPMLSACVARETARRAMLLDFFARF
jgi:uncharacterized protein YecT (DUF1311 family)